MKAKTFSKTLFVIICAFVCFAYAIPLYAQSDPSKEILVYFTSGVERGPAGQPAAIRSAAIQRMLARFNIDQSQLTSAFPNFNEADTLKQLEDGRTIGLPNVARIFKVRVPVGVKRQQVIDSLKNFPSVLFAELNGTAAPQVIPNDQYFANQWSLRPGGGTGKIQAPEAWDIYAGSTNTIIGIIDGGIDGTHPDLSGKVSGDNGWGWDKHGIHVAGIAAAKTNNSMGIAGVNWNAQLLAKRIDNLDDAGIYQKIIDAVNYSTNVNVLNNSWSLYNTDYSPRNSTTVRMAFAYAYKQNRVAVCSIGNYQRPQFYPNQTYYPSGFGQGIIAVGATDVNDVIADFSQVNSSIDVSAPGVSVYSTYRNPDYQDQDGTSMAAPHVSGIASLLKGYSPNLYNDDIEHIIQLAVDDKGPTGWDSLYGYGRVNAKKALDFLNAPYRLSQLTVTGGSSVSNTGLRSMAIFGASGLADGMYLVKRYDVQKTISLPVGIQQNVWGRGVASNGWSIESPNFAMGWCDAVPGSQTSSTVTLRTYVYYVYDIAMNPLGWYPRSPGNVTYAYTVLDKPLPPLTVSISCPYCIAKYSGSHTWYAHPSGGTGAYSYQWTSTVESGVLGTGSSLTKSYGPGFTLYLTVTSGSQTVSTSLGVGECTGGNGCDEELVSGDHANTLSGLVKSKTKAKADIVPSKFELEQNYPNPFNPSTTISFGIPEPSNVTLIIYNIQGQEVRTVFGHFLGAGYYDTTWDGKDNAGDQVASGIYIYRIQAGNFIQSKKMTFVK